MLGNESIARGLTVSTSTVILTPISIMLGESKMTIHNTNDTKLNYIDDVVPTLDSENLNAIDINALELNLLTDEQEQAYFEYFFEVVGEHHPEDYIVTVVEDNDPRFEDIHFDCESSDGITRR